MIQASRETRGELSGHGKATGIPSSPAWHTQTSAFQKDGKRSFLLRARWLFFCFYLSITICLLRLPISASLCYRLLSARGEREAPGGNGICVCVLRVDGSELRAWFISGPSRMEGVGVFPHASSSRAAYTIHVLKDSRTGSHCQPGEAELMSTHHF
ncbi:hypothetical protein B0T11DRAFT_110325 [Plectosphaerella cucumerina]|uniref:Uncharacterized protein n=1 Tax=Plectosphaerella cucumerina TaxID=40658 RepID=A0A8K0TDJ5_9PEZI|nr:hypothetical protein B0T11DRAFT_110325 [Plectosphaerella cucumerina]